MKAFEGKSHSDPRNTGNPSALTIFDFVGGPFLAGLAAGLLWMESRRQLRKRKVKQWERLKINAGLAAVAVVGLRLVLLPGMVAAARQATARKDGVLHLLKLPEWLKPLLAFLLLDYGNYGWHVLNHRLPFLWRFHNVHHTDLDLDVSTAWRFHAGEVAVGVLYRGGVVRLVGPSPFLVILYEIVFEAATAFHHSNWRLPYALEKNLSRLVVTPRMHGIHHSIIERETNSNFSVIFSFWDRLHHTLRLHIAQDAVNIGVPGYQSLHEQSVKNLLLMPFGLQRPWQLPDGTVPERMEGEEPKPEIIQP